MSGLQITTTTRKEPGPTAVDTGASYLLIVIATILLFAGPALVIAAWRWAL